MLTFVVRSSEVSAIVSSVCLGGIFRVYKEQYGVHEAEQTYVHGYSEPIDGLPSSNVDIVFSLLLMLLNGLRVNILRRFAPVTGLLDFRFVLVTNVFAMLACCGFGGFARIL